MKQLLNVNRLAVYHRNRTVLKDSSFFIKEKETVGIVGESGSGKSLTALAIMGLLPKELKLDKNSTIELLENTVIGKQSDIRGKEISMIFQEPMTSLNPVLTCGFQLQEVLMLHLKLSKKEAKKRTIELFEKVQLPSPEQLFTKYPHQLSGGQKQRVMIAIAISSNPKLLIADEPTTALDVTVQKDILLLLEELKKEIGMSMIFISHDLALVGEISDKIVVMKQGLIVEQGLTAEVFKNPKHPYTKALLACKPSIHHRYKKLPTVNDFLSKENKLKFVPEFINNEERKTRLNKLYKQEPLLVINNLEVSYVIKKNWFGRVSNEYKAVNGVGFKLYKGESLGLVGESGCGKTTIGRALLKLVNSKKGEIELKGKRLQYLSKEELIAYRKQIQIIFQDPYSSLNPRMQIGEAIREPIKVYNSSKTAEEQKEKVMELLIKVGLSPSDYYAYPHEFSGGQRQRISIARTLALEPEIIVCDESVSALDVSVQAQVLNLLNDLKNEFGLSYLFISHDLSVVKHFCDRVLVMNKKGEIEEEGESDSIYQNPTSEYTKKLIASIPQQ